MRWYARPEADKQQLRYAPQLASWNSANDPAQVRLRPYLDNTEALLAASRIDGQWALRLDVGRSTGRDLLTGADLDNFAEPLASRLNDPELVSLWCTKYYGEQSFVRSEVAREVLPPVTEVFVATPTASYERKDGAYKKQVQAAVAATTELPDGPVRLELSFLVGPTR